MKAFPLFFNVHIIYSFSALLVEPHDFDLVDKFMTKVLFWRQFNHSDMFYFMPQKIIKIYCISRIKNLLIIK